MAKKMKSAKLSPNDLLSGGGYLFSERNALRLNELDEKIDEFAKNSSRKLDVLLFARIWAPFGAPPESEIFVNFGMSPPRFAEVLFEDLSCLGVSLSTLHEFKLIYSGYI